MLLTAVAFSACATDVSYNREPGVFPGNPSEGENPVVEVTGFNLK